MLMPALQNAPLKCKAAQDAALLEDFLRLAQQLNVDLVT
jgi:hypothetical protein